MHARQRKPEGGPFLAGQVHSGDPFEISHGEPLRCAPTGGSGSGPNAFGASVLGWDPAVTEVGVDAGYSPAANMLRAPDVAIGNVPNKPGWIQGVPDLALEYADVGQDEEQLQRKIADLIEAGTKVLWVVRLSGPRRVEVYRSGERMRVALPGECLSAPGVLKNPVLVESLYDRDAAERATLINLLQRQGYDDLDAVLRQGYEKGREEGREEASLARTRQLLRRVLERRGIVLSVEAVARIEACRELNQLDAWHDRALDAVHRADVFGVE